MHFTGPAFWEEFNERQQPDDSGLDGGKLRSRYVCLPQMLHFQALM
jgi:hypothetical protein